MGNILFEQKRNIYIPLIILILFLFIFGIVYNIFSFHVANTTINLSIFYCSIFFFKYSNDYSKDIKKKLNVLNKIKEKNAQNKKNKKKPDEFTKAQKDALNQLENNEKNISLLYCLSFVIFGYDILRIITHLVHEFNSIYLYSGFLIISIIYCFSLYFFLNLKFKIDSGIGV